MFNDHEISPRSSAFVSPESRPLISYWQFQFSVSVDVSYIISEILDIGKWNELQISFKVIKIGTNRKLVYDFPLVVYSNFCRIILRRHSVCLIKTFNHSVRPIALHKLGLINSFLCIRWRLQHSLSSSHHGSEAALVGGTTSPQPTTNSERADDQPWRHPWWDDVITDHPRRAHAAHRRVVRPLERSRSSARHIRRYVLPTTFFGS